jgi:hypothetical protein
MLEYKAGIEIVKLFNILLVRRWRVKPLLVNINAGRATEMLEESGSNFSVT